MYNAPGFIAIQMGPRRRVSVEGGVGGRMRSNWQDRLTTTLGRGPFQDVPHRHRLPLSASRRRDAAPI
jgi:hypothetical protein